MRKETPSFVSFGTSEAGLILDDSNHPKYPIRFFNVVNGKGFIREDNCSYYGFVYNGFVRLETIDREAFTLSEGMYFSLSEPFKIRQGIVGSFVLVQVHHTKGIYPETNFSAMFNIGGSVEEVGRLKYIDGCTDSLLIPPVKKGDPCLNHLHFPENIVQTPHTHPSHRLGIVSGGEGECVTPFGNLPLMKGCIFVIKEYDGETKKIGLDGKLHATGTHKFNTTSSSMDVIAFHPDSDFGATDEEHPMINRTIVNGVSASKLKEIRTK